MLIRHLTPLIEAAIRERPVVYLRGARQTGKSTLVQNIAGQTGARYLTLDDAVVLGAAQSDPSGFVAGLDGPVVLDEVQRVPELLLAIKAAVDRRREPGRFLLTCSANPLALPRVADALVGRMELLTLHPLSQGEIEGKRHNFVDLAFEDRAPQGPEILTVGEDLADRILRGGYPEPVTTPGLRSDPWFSSYVTTILHRDVRDLSSIEGLTELPRLLRLIAGRTMGLLNAAGLSRDTGIPQTTLKRYLALLETTFLVESVPAWSTNLGKRLVKSPKMVVSDSGLTGHLLGLDAARLRQDRTMFGRLLEGFVAGELRRHVEWSERRPGLFHFRTHSGEEVDFVLETADGRVVGIEVKAAVSVGGGDFKGLRGLKEHLGDRFHRGIVLHAGPGIVPFGADLHAVPVERLWMGI